MRNMTLCTQNTELYSVCVVAFVSFASNNITNKKFAIMNSFVSEHFWNSPPKRCGVRNLGVTALPSRYATACVLLRSGVLLASDDAPGESRQNLSKLKAKLLSEAQVGARHQDARVDRRSQSDLYWYLGRTITQQTDHEWRTRLANRTVLQTRHLQTRFHFLHEPTHRFKDYVAEWWWTEALFGD